MRAEILDTVVVVLLAIGFPFALIVAWVYEVTPQGIKVTPGEGVALPTSTRSGQRLTYVIAGMLVIVVVLVAVENVSHRLLKQVSRQQLV